MVHLVVPFLRDPAYRTDLRVFVLHPGNTLAIDPKNLSQE